MEPWRGGHSEPTREAKQGLRESVEEFCRFQSSPSLQDGTVSFFALYCHRIPSQTECLDKRRATRETMVSKTESMESPREAGWG